VIFDVMKPNPVKQIKAHQKVLSAMDIHEDKGIVTASHDGTVCFWKLK
jgi:WD40 repeat protein